MSIREIVEYPDTRLREICTPVEQINDDVLQLLNDMAETMYAAPGIGLAAPQVGVLKRIIVIDTSSSDEESSTKKLYKLINPEILEKNGETIHEEGCLSIPDIREKVKRFESITIKALDEKGDEIIVEASGLLAICIQHELDHLDGILFIDRLSRVKQQLIRSKLQKLSKKKSK
jgi:peptide deformylase